MRLIKRILLVGLLCSCPLAFNGASSNTRATLSGGATHPLPFIHTPIPLPRVDAYYYGDYPIYEIKARIAALESADNYLAVNSRGYLGKYQFHPKTLAMLGYGPTKIKYFLLSPKMQEEAMDKLLAYNYKFMQDTGLLIYVGTTIKGICITEAGLLAASHLLGVGSVKYWLHNGGVCKRQKRPYSAHCTDSNGTSLEKYLNLFN